MANITGLDRIGIPVAVAIRPASRTLVVAQGKGITLTDAKVSAVMESIELHHAERPAVPIRIASQQNLRRENAKVLDCAAMPQLAGHEFDDTAALCWTRGRDLISRGRPWVPFAYVAVDDSATSLAVPPSVPVNSNGLASGNTMEEAIIHALCELIERDAIALWQLASHDERRGRAVDLSTIDDPNCRDLLALYDRAEIDVHVFDLTSDIGLPVYEVFVRERCGSRDSFSAVGSGCHAWRGIALSRALTEAAQCRLTHIAGAREDLVRSDYAAEPARVAQLDRYLSWGKDAARPFRPPSEQLPRPTETLSETLTRIIDALRAVGIEQIVAVDLSTRGTGLCVVRLLVPGLEGLVFEPGYVPGARGRAALAMESAL